MGEEKNPEEVQEQTDKESSASGQGWTKPGHIPEPKEKSWTAEKPNPYDEVDRDDPFEGRPQTEVPTYDDAAADSAGTPAEHPAPGQPLPRNDDE